MSTKILVELSDIEAGSRTCRIEGIRLVDGNIVYTGDKQPIRCRHLRNEYSSDSYPSCELFDVALKWDDFLGQPRRCPACLEAECKAEALLKLWGQPAVEEKIATEAKR